MFKIILVLAFLIRIFLVPHPGFKADIAYWKWWGMSAAHDGITGPLVNTAYNYPSFYLYILKATSHLYELFTGFNFALDPHSAVFWNDQNVLYLFLIKLPYLLADLGIGLLIYRIVLFVIARSRAEGKTTWRSNERLPLPLKRDRNDKVIALLSASFYLFNPTVIYNSALWGQTDSLGSLFVLMAFYFLLQKRFSLVGIFSAVAVFMKTQTIIFLPLFFLVIFLTPSQDKRLRFSALVSSLWVFIATVIVINLPFLLNHLMDRVFDIMYTSQLYFPYVSMNAYNLWWIFFGKNSPSFWDQNLLTPFLTFKTAGVLLFGFVYALAIALLFHIRSVHPRSVKLADSQELIANSRIMLSSIILASFAFFMLLTQMHERYLFPLFAFFPILLGLEYINKNKLRFGLLTIVYSLLSVLILLNLHQVMVMNYSDNTLPFFPNTFSEELTRVIAMLNLAVFIIITAVLTYNISFITKTLLLVLFLFLLFFQSLPKSLVNAQKIVSLTKLKPAFMKQDFGTLSVNKNLSNNWLSILYYYSLDGLATHARSEIVYDLNLQYKTFTSIYGIDNDANTNASVVFVIKDETQKELFRSGKMGRFSFPGYLKIDVSRVKKLYLIVEDAGDGINSDHADWLDPRLYK